MIPRGFPVGAVSSPRRESPNIFWRIYTRWSLPRDRRICRCPSKSPRVNGRPTTISRLQHLLPARPTPTRVRFDSPRGRWASRHCRFRSRGRTLWWSWTPAQEGLALIELGGTGTSPDTVIGIYTGTSLENLQLLTAEDEGGPNHGSLAAFLTTPGVTYYLQADLYDDGEIATGPVQVSATLQSLPPLSLRPANDAFAQATVLDGVAGRSEANTQYATGRIKPRDHGGTRSQSVWWRYTPPTAGVLRLRTHGSTTSSGAPLDTVLALYSGGSLGTLEELETNDDAGGLLTSGLNAYVEAGRVFPLPSPRVVGSPAGMVRLDYQLIDAFPAPSWTARALDESLVRSSEFAGSVQLVNLWATWCGPCLAEIPDLISLYEKYRSQGFVVIGVSVDDAIRAPGNQVVRSPTLSLIIRLPIRSC